MSAHTPGPWTLREPVKATGDERNDMAIAALVDGEPSVIAECFWRVGVQRFAPSDENARLIAAAPALLEALEQMTSAYDSVCMTRGIREMARAALRAAKGDQ